MSSNETSTPIKGQPSEKQLQLLGAIMQNCQGKLDINVSVYSPSLLRPFCLTAARMAPAASKAHCSLALIPFA